MVVSPDHDDFPALLAEALDVLMGYSLDVKETSAALGCTSSQLIKFLKLEPRAFAMLNDQRHRAGLHALQ
jgi:hypothetical protein